MRLAFVTVFPSRPFGDFRDLIRFAEAFRADAWARGAPEWELRGLGLPLALSLVLRVVAGPSAVVARYATAVMSGLVSLAPFLILRGVYSLRTRVVAGLLLALWPGHVMVSGVVSQDNWVLLPTVALAALAARVLRRPARTFPVTAALLWAVSGAIRQEMFVVLLPAALAAAGLSAAWSSRDRAGLLRFGAAAAVALFALAGLRWMGSGRFSLTTEHTGMAVLGAESPGAGSTYWTFGQTYFAAFAPEVADDWSAMKRQASRLALRELARRPRFHLVRMVAAGSNSLLRSDSDGLFTSIGSHEAMPPPSYERGQRITARATGPLRAGTLLLLGAALAALASALRPVDAPVLLIGGTLLLKAVVHAVTVAQYRYFGVVTALALLLVALTAERLPRARTLAWCTAAGVAGAMLLALVAARAEAWVVDHEEQLTYRFVLKDPGRNARLHCVVRQGILTLLYAPRDAAIRLLHANPSPGEAAVAECSLEARRATDALVFEFRDGLAAGGLPARVTQVVAIDGIEVVRHDLAAEAGEGWIQVPLGPLDPDRPRQIVLRVTSGTTEPGWGWHANTPFRLTDAP